MPALAPRQCHVPGCGTLDCQAHGRPAERAKLDERRGSAHARGYDSRWTKFRDAYLRKHPLCRHCERAGRVEPATVADHIRPHRGDRRLFWLVPSNIQPLCRRCHAAKGIRENGMQPCAHPALAQVADVMACEDCGRVAA